MKAALKDALAERARIRKGWLVELSGPAAVIGESRVSSFTSRGLWPTRRPTSSLVMGRPLT